MSDFIKKFLLEDGRRLNPSGRFVGLAAFGKHPGWDDHVEDLGLETEGLNIAKTVLYVNGIGGQIDSGAWEKLDAAQQLPVFKHIFLWQRSGQILLGRMWSSSDGKGRKKYPMVVCLHFIGVTLGWALKQGLPALEELEAGCLKTNSAADVRSLLSHKTSELRAALSSAEVQGDYAPISLEVMRKIVQPSPDAPPEDFLRVLYQIQSQFGAFAAGTFNARAATAAMHSQQIRVPMAGANPQETLLFWTRFFLMLVDGAVPLLLTLPLGAGWVDVTAGEPESHDLFSLRASPKAMPLVSEVPYNMDAAFRAKALKFLESFEHGATTADLQTTAAVEGDTSVTGKGGWRKWFGIGAVLVVCGLAAALLLPKGGKETPQTVATATNQQVVKNDTAPAGTPETDTAKAEAEREKARRDAEIEAARVAEAKKNADALAAAEQERQRQAVDAAEKEKQRQMAAAAENEKARQAAAAAAKEREQQIAENAAREKEKQIAAAEQEKQRQQSQQAEAAEKQRQQQLAAAEKDKQDQLAAEARAKQAELDAAAAKAKEQQQAEAAAREKERVAAETAARERDRVAAEAATKQQAVQMAALAAQKQAVYELAKSNIEKAATSAPAGTPATAMAQTATSEITNTVDMVLVPLPSGIWAGKYEVTQGEWMHVIFANPSASKNKRQPVESVSWIAANDFCTRLTDRERSRGKLPPGMVYRLPTEKQWLEFLGGQKFEDLPDGGMTHKGQPSEVGSAGVPNKFGMYDVLGNVWEWCLDGGKGDEKLLKGGAYDSGNYDRTLPPDMKAPDCGFRCVLVTQQ